MLSKEEATFIESCRVAHLATADSDGQPHVVPVCFAHVEGAFWIAVDEKPKRTQQLKRLRNIEQNPAVALLFDRYNENWDRLGFVLVRGTADIVRDGPEKGSAIGALRLRYEQYQSMALEDRPAIRIAPQRVTNWGSLA
jgi:PPOX class probable F420-dependent enzyme